MKDLQNFKKNFTFTRNRAIIYSMPVFGRHAVQKEYAGVRK